MYETKIEIGTPGIRRALSKYDALRSIAEFIWNGFDAGASVVEIQYEANELGYFPELRVVDNGSGIVRSELDKKFKPFLHTNKVIDPTTVQHGPSAVHGKNGIGRLTFFKFAQHAEWITTYKIAPSQFRKYRIEISADRLNTLLADTEEDSIGPAGTMVRFTGVTELNDFEFEAIKHYLACEFAWFLELKAPFGRSIKVNNEVLNYEALVGDRDSFDRQLDGQTFGIRYVRWRERLHDEYSRYYFIGSDNQERAKKHTTLNNKGDGFYHSVYIHSVYFDSIKDVVILPESNSGNDQAPLPLAEIDRDETFRELLQNLEEYLHGKRKPFLRKRAIKFVKELEGGGAFPSFSPDPWDQHRRQELIEVVREVYEADPRIFNGLNAQQKQTIVQLFHLTMNSSERDSLLDVLTQVVYLESKERADLAAILRTTRLSHVVSTIKMISDRFVALDELKKLVFCPEFGANERDHLQTHIERHYWIFGEQYHLVTAAEPDFEQALNRFVYYLYGDTKPRRVKHADKNKEMDIFAVRLLPQVNEINNIVVELKHPEIELGEKELRQVKKYMSVILDQPEFNGTNMNWVFYLVGTSYNSEIVGELESAKAHGERHLAYKRANYKIYVMSWSEVLTNIELRHKFILDKLKLERDKLVTTKSSADGIIADGHKNTASRP
jgi:hypothetical protein